VPEVIDDGITGFVVPGEAEAVEAIGRLSELDRQQVRRHFEKRFTTSRMAQEYLRHYKALVQPNAGEVSGALAQQASRSALQAGPRSGTVSLATPGVPSCLSPAQGAGATLSSSPTPSRAAT
jgi:hypothetical protein